MIVRCFKAKEIVLVVLVDGRIAVGRESKSNPAICRVVDGIEPLKESVAVDEVQPKA